MKQPSMTILCPGDAAGIGPEITAKALAVLADQGSWIVLAMVEPFVLEMRRHAPLVPLTLLKPLNLYELPALLAEYRGQSSRVIVLDPELFIETQADLAALRKTHVPAPIAMGVVAAWPGLMAAAAIAGAVWLARHAGVTTVVTGCINKESLRLAGVKQIGHTELFADYSASPRPLTMFQTGSLRIFFLSRHVSLRQACDLVSARAVADCLMDCDRAMQGLGLERRRIAVAGLNPHCGEHGLFGDEEGREIEPGIQLAKAARVDAHGPVGADSVFYQARMGQWDAVLSLYHDQGHIAAKTLDFDGTITLTLGLPFLRVSVDHGTAFDIAGQGIARSRSMEMAIQSALDYQRSS